MNCLLQADCRLDVLYLLVSYLRCVLGAGSVLLLGQTRADQLHQQPVVCRGSGGARPSTGWPVQRSQHQPAAHSDIDVSIVYTIFCEALNRGLLLTTTY